MHIRYPISALHMFKSFSSVSRSTMAYLSHPVPTTGYFRLLRFLPSLDYRTFSRRNPPFLPLSPSILVRLRISRKRARLAIILHDRFHWFPFCTLPITLSLLSPVLRFRLWFAHGLIGACQRNCGLRRFCFLIQVSYRTLTIVHFSSAASRMFTEVAHLGLRISLLRSRL
jgi:hypothetical protein